MRQYALIPTIPKPVTKNPSKAEDNTAVPMPTKAKIIETIRTAHIIKASFTLPT